MSMDWGSAKPFSVGWYVVSEGAVLAEKNGWPERWLAPGAVIRYAEYYGWDGKPNQGCRLESPAVARDILKMEEDRGDPPMDYRIGDSAMWAKSDGPSPQERMRDATNGVFVLRQSQKDRQHNYNEILARLAGDEEGHPQFFVTAGCQHFWRTVPSLTLDPVDPERGPDSKLEDHVYDEVAYALRSRPFVITAERRDDIEYRALSKKHRPRRGYG